MSSLQKTAVAALALRHGVGDNLRHYYFAQSEIWGHFWGCMTLGATKRMRCASGDFESALDPRPHCGLRVYTAPENKMHTHSNVQQQVCSVCMYGWMDVCMNMDTGTCSCLLDSMRICARHRKCANQREGMHACMHACMRTCIVLNTEPHAHACACVCASACAASNPAWAT